MEMFSRTESQIVTPSVQHADRNRASKTVGGRQNGEDSPIAGTDPFPPRTARRLTVVLVLSALASTLFAASEPDGTGTGFIVHPDGYILSNRHVVEGADKIIVVLSGGTEYTAKVVETGKAADLALLKINAKDLPAVAIGDSDRVEVLDYVMAIGYPLATIIGTDASPSEGKINAKRAEEEIPLFQIDANINPGNSGGPLVNDRGEVIGVIVSKLNAAEFLKKGGFVPERINYAIPVNFAKGLLKKAYPLGVPQSQNSDKLEPKDIFKSLKPSVVLIATYGGTVMAGGGKDEPLKIPLPGMPAGAKTLELVLIESGEERFLIGKYEVTQAQYEAVMGNNPSEFKYGANYPVETVSWDDARKFCAKLTALLRQVMRDDYPEGLKFRLPTDEEWSIAVGLENEAGSTPEEKHEYGKIKNVYPWGTQWPPPRGTGNYADEAYKQKLKERCWGYIERYDDGYAATAPVGSFKPNKYGLYDLGGNVMEWCEDSLYKEWQSPVLRGAAYSNCYPENLLSSRRDYGSPGVSFSNMGFRVVLGGSSP